MKPVQHVAIIGFGEVGQRLAADLLPRGVKVSAFDVRFEAADSAPSRAVQKMADVRRGTCARDAIADCQMVISAVTAGQSQIAAVVVANDIEDGVWFVDLNSVSPMTRAASASEITTAGGCFVECAVMSPIQPHGIGSPMLLGGEHATDFYPLAQQLGFERASVYSSQLGRASAAKMCRSVIIKGLEALVTESMLSARQHGVESIVIDSLENLLPGVDWTQHAQYLISRSIAHGMRRAEEMQQVVQTLQEVNVAPLMSEACATRQAMAPRFADASATEPLAAMLDQILNRKDIDLL
ncbi:MAG: DUF1932 domain-containing protein [Woeseiaceae bacterium]